MALNCNKLTGSDFAIATSGIAGPEGGTPEKPVGLVWMAVAYQQNVESFSLQFRGSRDDIREKASYHLLNQLRLHPKLHNFSLAHLSTID
jgi:PncC family amidohydrolase